jgi:hypothetical protein
MADEEAVGGYVGGYVGAYERRRVGEDVEEVLRILG